MQSGESTFTLFSRYDHQGKTTADEACGGSIIIWGYSSSSGLLGPVCQAQFAGPLQCDVHTNEVGCYMTIPNDQIIPTIDFFFLFFTDSTAMSQDDKPSVHQVHIVKELFREHEASFSYMDWPPQSPDPNPAENL